MSRAMIEDGSGMKPLVVVGDKTSHGGVVVSGDGNRMWDGKPIARKGDTVMCPKCSPHVFTIEEGTTHFMVGDRPAALHNYKTTCGATLIAEAASVSQTAVAMAFLDGNGYDEKVQAINPIDGKPLQRLAYFVEMADGSTLSGFTDDNGHIPRIFTENQEEFTVHWGVDALEKMSEEDESAD